MNYFWSSIIFGHLPFLRQGVTLRKKLLRQLARLNVLKELYLSYQIYLAHFPKRELSTN